MYGELIAIRTCLEALELLMRPTGEGRHRALVLMMVRTHLAIRPRRHLCEWQLTRLIYNGVNLLAYLFLKTSFDQ